MKTIAFFNNKGGVGKTSLVYHLSWMFSMHGLNILAVDLDPQSNLTSMFLEDDRLEELWDGEEHKQTIYGAIRPILRGTGDILTPHVEVVSNSLGLINGDLGLSRFEDKLSDAWPRCHNRDESAFRTMTVFHRLALLGGKQCQADLALIDVGPNLGAINRAALIAAENVVIPLSADLFSLQGLRNLGPTMKEWRGIWTELIPKAPEDIDVPKGLMSPTGYVVSRHGVVESRPVKSYQRWVQRIPETFRESVLGENSYNSPDPANDPYALAMLKHYRSLMPMAMNSRKPMFSLRASDGAIGAHVEAVHACYDDFLRLAKRIGEIIGVAIN
ncbi:MAG: ParA family protein [Fusobacteriaceae bacterium]|jgi:cellulose biosynthesis protein BcsQ|nr:ParA family protein [Fusobacteriaceae bacterium]